MTTLQKFTGGFDVNSQVGHGKAVLKGFYNHDEDTEKKSPNRRNQKKVAFSRLPSFPPDPGTLQNRYQFLFFNFICQFITEEKPG